VRQTRVVVKDPKKVQEIEQLIALYRPPQASEGGNYGSRRCRKGLSGATELLLSRGGKPITITKRNRLYQELVSQGVEIITA